VIKIAQVNRSISFDVTPHSSRVGAPKEPPFYKGWQYDKFVEDAHKILDNLKDYYPDYEGQGYEIAGFCWWQGHKDHGIQQLFYELHLVNLIKDLRKEFKAPNAPFAIATVGFDGKNMSKGYREILKAQMAVAKAKEYPEFAGNVMTVDARPFWRSKAQSPGNHGHHYNQNAETYYLVGDDLGRMMVTMLEAQKAKSDD
jgi:alpha-galactosidase